MDFFAGLITGVVLGIILAVIFWENSDKSKNK